MEREEKQVMQPFAMTNCWRASFALSDNLWCKTAKLIVQMLEIKEQF